MGKIRIGVIGCGYWGPNLIRNFIEIPEADVVAVTDLQASRLEHIQSRYQQIAFTSQNYRDLFELGLDAVVVATPPPSHFAVASECLLHGLHVLVEKPLTLNSRDACELIRIADEQDKILMVGHTFEYNPAVRALKEMITSGEIGTVQYIDAVRVSLGLFQTGLNVIWDLAPHDLSILLYLLDQTPTAISAQGTSCVQDGLVDVAYLTAKFQGNILAHIRTSWLDPCKTRRITVVGSKKMVLYDDVESQEKIRIYDKGVQAIRRTDTFGEFQFAYHYGDIITPFIRLEEPLKLECQHYLECIREHKQPISGGRSGLRVVQAIEAAQRSLLNGGNFEPVEIGQVVEQVA